MWYTANTDTHLLPRIRIRLRGSAVLIAAVIVGTAAAAGAAPMALPDLWIADRTAHALGLAPGDTLETSADAAMRGARLFRVAGVYRPQADPFEIGFGRLGVRMHLPDLAALLGAGERVDRFVLRARTPQDGEALAADLNRAGLGLRAYTAEELAARSSSTFVVISQFHKAIGIVSLLAGLVFLAALLVLKFEEMRRELAVLRLVGVSQRTVVRTVAATAAAVALAGSVVGIGLGALALAIINPLAQRRYDTDLVFARWSLGVVGLAVGLAILLGILAGLFVALRYSRGNVLEQIGR